MTIPIFAYITGIFSIIPVIVGYFLINSLPKEIVIFLWLLTISAIMTIVTLLLAEFNFNNMLLFHIYTLLEYGFLITVFSYWQKSVLLKISLRLSIAIFTLVWISAKIYVENSHQFDNFTSSLASSILVVVSVYTLFEMVKENNIDSLYSEPRFWISTAVLIYFSGNLVTFALSSIIVIWSIHNTLHIISDLCYIGGFLCLRRR